MKILVVEDNVTMASALRFVLQHLGLRQIVVTADGGEALRLLKTDHFDLLIVDWMLPSLSGVALVKWMRERDDYVHTPVIMVTTKDQAEDVLTAVEAGVNEYVLKPLDKDVLRGKIEKVMARRKRVVAASA